MTETTLQFRFKRLCDNLRSLGKVTVAYSGGVDSVFLLKAAADTLGPPNVLAVIGNSASLSTREFAEAKRLCTEIGVQLIVVEPGEFDDSRFVANPTNRCFYCKDALYKCILQTAKAHGIAAVVCGTNADDLSDFRPGHKAADQHGIHSPCADAGLTKADIRALSAELGLPTADKPAAPCLASRVQYGETITPQKMRMIEEAEAVLHGLGYRECRVRHHGNIARIEVPAEHIEALAAETVRNQIDAMLREIGYQYVTLDLRGFRSGSMNEVIPQ